jgi:pyrimidine-nucleoside phosphorylase
MLPVQIIQKKRDKEELSKEEIHFFIDNLVKGDISSAQAGAFLMTCFINGLSEKEISYLTYSMTFTGEMLKYPKSSNPIIDKHSSGGVGDKISLLLLPICTALGIDVPMISGRGLGHTGGTLDKLESISGFKIMLSEAEINRCMKELGGFIVGQTTVIAPADKILYQLRDVTATVDSYGLITASILSKKLAEGLSALVMDIKVGDGAFMKNIEMAKVFGRIIKQTGLELGLKMSIVYSAMDEPLGYNIGNFAEIVETEECLKGKIPADIKEVTYKLAEQMLLMSGKYCSSESANQAIDEVINSGQALTNFYKFIELQSGNLEKSKEEFKKTKSYVYNADRSGYIHEMDALQLGILGIILKAGRRKEDDIIDYYASIILKVKVSDYVNTGDTILEILYNSNFDKDEVINILNSAIIIKSEKIDKKTIVLGME